MTGFAGHGSRLAPGRIVFQQVTYGGMPVVVDALGIYAEVLTERGEPLPAEE